MLAEAVLGWLSGLPSWQQDLARRLAERAELDEAEYAEVLAMVKAANGLALQTPAVVPRPITAGDLGSDPGQSAVRLIAIGGLEGVGLVAKGERLTFAETGLTVVYGPNAAGKSSFVRALKKLCRTVDADSVVRPSVYDTATPGVVPSAEVTYRGDGEETTVRTPLTDGALRLTGMSVFDSRCAELYTDSENTVQFVPVELRLLVRLAALQNRLRHTVSEERDAVLAQRPSVDRYPGHTQVGAALRRLAGTTADPDLAALSQLTTDEMARLAELRSSVEAASSPTSRADAAAARRESREARELCAILASLQDAVSEPATRNLREAAARDAAAREAVRIDAQELTGPVEGIGSQPWALLWQAARDFVAAGGGVFPPTTGQHCPLCLQSISAEAAERMAHFERHVSGNLRAVAAQRARELQTALSAVAPERASAARVPLLAALGESEPETAEAVAVFIGAVESHMTGMAADPGAAGPADITASGAIAALNVWADSRDSRAAILEAADDPVALAAIKQELAELEARTALASDLERFVAWQRALALAADLDRVYAALATNRISLAQKELAESQLNEDLEAALDAELKGLSCTLPVAARTRTQLAQMRVAVELKCVTSARVADVASEGERRALALAFFFAELTVAAELGGIIVDDPVSSLDDERRWYIAERLVEESLRRQVIVFTHDLPFLFDLQASAKNKGVEPVLQGIWRFGDQVGRVDADPPFAAMKLNKRIGKLKQRAQQWDSLPPPATQQEAWDRVTSFYKDMRDTWERAVEEGLFKGVVRRFQRDVKTLALKDVVITPELIKDVNDGMSRASKFLHDAPAAGGVEPIPSRVDLERDVAALTAFAAKV
jgi:hypothetical protein